MSSRKSTYAARRAFSLIEVMIAIILLGFGLVMVATMYPIAWNRARTMTEQSMTGSIADSAEVLLRRVLQVDGGKVKQASTAEYPDRGSFAGDQIVYTPDGAPGPDILYYSDTRVHALHMENVLVAPGTGPRRFYPDWKRPDKEKVLPFQLERLQPDQRYIPGEEYNLFPHFYKYCFGKAQVRFEDRFYPPLPHLRENVNDMGHFTGDDPSWEDSLDTRRFAFAVFHRQRGAERKFPAMPPAPIPPPADRIVGPDFDYHDFVGPGFAFNLTQVNPTPEQITMAFRESDYPRTFDVYIVSLRRGQSAYRFAQQDPNHRFCPDPRAREVAAKVRPLPPDQDLLLPVPWRVQIYIPSGKPQLNYELRRRVLPVPPGTVQATEGSPTIAYVNDTDHPTSPFLVDLFQEGTWFIDEHNGQIYQVARRTIEPGSSSGDQATLTLDREITVEDINDYCPYDGLGSCQPNFVLEFEGQEQLRTVWVFPPPVEGRLPNGDPFFEGDSPVIGIEVRTLTFAPRP